jgi:hypothetical protein
LKKRFWRCGVALVLASALAFLHPAEAAPIGQNLGLGENLCAQFSKAYADKPAAEQDYWNWAMGMMSGLNFASIANSNVFRDLTGDEDIYRRAIRLYCSNHPLTSYSGAVLDLYVSMPLKKSGSH